LIHKAKISGLASALGSALSQALTITKIRNNHYKKTNILVHIPPSEIPLCYALGKKSDNAAAKEMQCLCPLSLQQNF
jgi:hypothetical protein